jgi:serine/threonine protein kinase
MELVLSDMGLELERQIGIGKKVNNVRAVVYTGYWKGERVLVEQFPISIDALRGMGWAEFNEEISGFVLKQEILNKYVNKYIACGQYEGLLCIIFELVEGGNLHNYLMNANNIVDNELMLEWAYQISSAMLEIEWQGNHLCGLVTSNILLDSNLNTRLSDIIITRDAPDATGLSKSNNMTVASFPPELFERNPVIGPKTDAYAFGMILWEILTRRRPYEGQTHAQIYVNVYQGMGLEPLPAQGPAVLIEIIGECWNYHPNLRPTMADITSRICSVIDG